MIQKTEILKIVSKYSRNGVLASKATDQLFDLIEERFNQYQKESIEWSVEDFTEYKLKGWKINKKQAQEALENMIHNHDAGIGITWDTIKYYITEYGTKK